jgi:hypothetical protein
MPKLGFAGRTLAVAAVYWASKRFTDRDLIPGGAASLDDPEKQEVRAAVELLKQLHPTQTDKLNRAAALIDQLEASPSAQDEFATAILDVIESMRPADRTEEGLAAMRSLAGRELLSNLSTPVLFPRPADNLGGAAGLGDTEEGAAGIGALFGGIVGGAAKLLNYTTYYTMKERAGAVGSGAVHDALVRVQQKHPAIRLHLVGHSFGGRLVSAIAKGRAGAPPLRLRSLCLLQAAFSHFGFATDAARSGKPGFFRNVLSDGVLEGPAVVTHSRWDTAVGYAYAVASRAAGQNASALGDADDPYGGIGRNGALVTPEATFGKLQKAGTPYSFTAKRVHNLDGAADDKATSLVTDHGDVTNEAVVYACLSAMR